jgi:uncharacterized CHY-type Zn-finger protein
MFSSKCAHLSVNSRIKSVLLLYFVHHESETAKSEDCKVFQAEKLPIILPNASDVRFIEASLCPRFWACFACHVQIRMHLSQRTFTYQVCVVLVLCASWKRDCEVWRLQSLSSWTSVHNFIRFCESISAASSMIASCWSPVFRHWKDLSYVV